MFRIDQGGLSIRDGSRTVFDTNDRMLHLIGRVNGTTPYYTYSAGNSVGKDLSDRVSLGTVDPVCTQVIGAVKMELSQPYSGGLQYNRWHMVMGGTVVWLMDGEPGFQDALGDNAGLTQYVGYHFTVSGGVVYLNRRVMLDRIPATYIVKAHRLVYRLRAGTWV